MSGYSGTPLPKKLGLKDGLCVSFVGLPSDIRAELKAALASCKLGNGEGSALDFAMMFSKSRSDLAKEFNRLAKLLDSAGMLWVAWPKKTSGVVTDVNENIVREVGLDAGLVDVKVCAVSEVWSGLKFVRRVKDR
jgi:cyanate permease